MPKNSFVTDTFEKAMEFGVSSAKKVAHDVVTSLNPIQPFMESISAPQGSQEKQNIEKMSEMKGEKSTPLNFENLQKKYASQDEQKLQATRQRYFQTVQNNERNAIEQMKRAEQERQSVAEHEEEEKRQRAFQSSQQYTAEEPHGKIRKNILGSRKAHVSDEVLKTHQEYKGGNKMNGQ